MREELERKINAEKELASLKGQLKAGSLTFEGKKYFLQTEEQKKILDAFEKNLEVIEKGEFRYVRTKKPKPKGKILEFD